MSRRAGSAVLVPEEHQEQCAVIEWSVIQCQWAELVLLHAIPNGGLRNPVVAKKLKAEGVKAGVPDLCLPVPRGNYHGLYIEMKRTKGSKTSAAQKSWHEMLINQGYRVVVCKGAQAAIDEINNYMKLGQFS